MTGETHPRDSYPGTGDRALLKKKNKDGVPGKVWFPCTAGTVANCGTSAWANRGKWDTHGRVQGGATLGATDGPRACQGRKTMRIKHRCRHGRRHSWQNHRKGRRSRSRNQRRRNHSRWEYRRRPQHSKLLNAATDQEQTKRTLRRRVEAGTMPRPLCLCKKN